MFGPALVAELPRHHAEQLERRLIIGPANHVDEDLVVAKIDGAPIRSDYASQAFGTWSAASACPRTWPAPAPTGQCRSGCAMTIQRRRGRGW
jgi:hypothetical protein